MKSMKKSKWDKDITITAIRDVEQRVLNYMLLSASNFNEIKTQLEKNYFLFTIHRRIFKQLVNHKDCLLKDNDFSIDSINIKVSEFAFPVWFFERIRVDATKEILSQKASTDIKNDLEIIQTLYAQRTKSLSKENNIVTVIAEDKNSYAKSYFMNDIVIEIETRGIMHLPQGLFYYFKDVLNYLSEKDLESEDIEVTMSTDTDTDEIESIHIRKNLSDLSWVKNLCSWADKYGLDEDKFPRTRQELEDLEELMLNYRGIEELPKEIHKLQNLKVLYLCNNNIKTLPDELFRMQTLIDFCVHSNQITVISEKIGNLSNLMQLSISNNNISVLPQSIVNLKKLKSFDMENTLITKIPDQFIKNTRLFQLCINDELLPDIVKNVQYLGADTINLTASHLDKSMKIIQSLNFKFDDTAWIDDNAITDKGCILFKKDRIASVVKIANKLMEEKQEAE